MRIKNQPFTPNSSEFQLSPENYGLLKMLTFLPHFYESEYSEYHHLYSNFTKVGVMYIMGHWWLYKGAHHCSPLTPNFSSLSDALAAPSWL